MTGAEAMDAIERLRALPHADAVRNLTLANQLTILRIMLIPAFVLLVVYGRLGAALLVFWWPV